MKNKDLIRILKRFPREARVFMFAAPDSPSSIQVSAAQTHKNEWTIVLKADEKIFQESGENSCKDEKN